jgi:hypothetical protein
MSTQTKTRCKKCGARVPDTLQDKWQHIVVRHTEEFFQGILPLLFDPARAREMGADLARRFINK